ncbi:10348_t:CDS:2, partial [Gigaspora rosea]
GEKNLFASAEDFDLKKDDKENRSCSHKIDIVWATKPLKIEFAPNEHQYSHYFNDKIKIAIMLKVMLNSLNLLKLMGYKSILFIPYKGITSLEKLLETSLPTTNINLSLLRR